MQAQMTLLPVLLLPAALRVLLMVPLLAVLLVLMALLRVPPLLLGTLPLRVHPLRWA